MRKLLFLSLCLITSIAIYAKEVTEQQALQKAQLFLQGRSIKLPISARKVKGVAKTEKTNSFYIFNVENNNGFIIVSGEDQTPDILGYSEHGNLDLTNLPCNMKWLLSYYEQCIGIIRQDPGKVGTIKKNKRDEVSPFITTQWGQDQPYNKLCPILNGNNCQTGCVATAMAQAINYTRWPQDAIPSIEDYTTETKKIYMPSLGPTSFDWNDLAEDDIARLMLYCGQALKMDYDVDGSGAHEEAVSVALVNIFGYSSDTRLLRSHEYSPDEWEDIIYQEIVEKRPVIFTGFTGDSNGHTFVLNGYRDDKFYVNWGWEGNGDGYFLLTGLLNFLFNQSAVIGIQPPTGNEKPEVFEPTVTSYECIIPSVSRNSVSDNFPGFTITSYVDKASIGQIFSYGLFNGNTLVQELAKKSGSYTILDHGDGTYVNNYIDEIESNTPNGKYQIKTIYRENEKSNWIVCKGSDMHYIDVDIDDLNLTLTLHSRTNNENYVVGVFTLNGVTYKLYVILGNLYADVLPFKGNGKYSGDIYIPDSVSYKGDKYRVVECDWDVFSNCPELISISTSLVKGMAIENCPKLKTLDFRYGMIDFYYPIKDCPALESISYPSSLMDVQFFPERCNNLKTIRYNNTQGLAFLDNPWYITDFSENSNPSLTDIFFTTNIPPVYKKDMNYGIFAPCYDDIPANPNVTIHIPQGTLDVYKRSIWKNWKFVEDQDAVPLLATWDYFGDLDTNYGGIGWGVGEDDAEYAIRIPSESILPYKGCKISSIQFYTSPNYGGNRYPYDRYDYVFITKQGTDYLIKQPVGSYLNGNWISIDLQVPYTITGEEIFVGIGRAHAIEAPMAAEKYEPNGFWARAMGNDPYVTAGVWRMEDDNHPLPIRICIDGDNIPTDMQIEDIQIVKQTLSAVRSKVSHRTADDCNSVVRVQMTVRNRTPQLVRSFTIEWNVDGVGKGNTLFETALLPCQSETVIIEIPYNTSEEKQLVDFNIIEVDGKADEIPSNSKVQEVFVASDVYSKSEKGDANGDGKIDSRDIVAIVNYMMSTIPPINDIDEIDMNGDGVINIADIIQIIKPITGASEVNPES